MSTISSCAAQRRAVSLSSLFLILAAGAAGVVVGPAPAGADTQVSGTSAVYMSADGTGKACTRTQPCSSLSAALAASTDGGTVVAAAGDYGTQTVGQLTRGQTPKSVTVTSATGRDAVFDKTSINQPGITFDSVTFRTGLVINKGPTTVRNVHVVDGTLLVRADNTLITDSLIEGGYGRDGINIAGSPGIIRNVTVRGNTVRDIGASTKDRPQHPDCVQVFDAQHITIEQNNLYNCYNSGLTFSPGARQGITDVLVRANFIQGCITSRNPHCGGGSSMDLRTIEASNITVTQNTFGAGPLRLPYNPTITATRNIVGYLNVAKPCTTSLSDSLIAAYPTWACKDGAPGRTTSSNSNNSVGSVTYSDQPNGDMHVTGADTSAKKSQSTGLAADAQEDIDGQPFDGSMIGADQPGAPGDDKAFRTTPSAVVGSIYRPSTGVEDATFVVADESRDVCSSDGTLVTFTRVGTCTVDAVGPDDGDSFATQTLAVGPGRPTAALAIASNTLSAGQDLALRPTVTPAAALPGTAQLLVDGAPVGSTKRVVDNEPWTIPAFASTVASGAHRVAVRYTPDTDQWAPTDSPASTVTVGRRAVSMAAGFTRTGLRATVTPVGSSSTTPTGKVVFSLQGRVAGTAPVHNGEASLPTVDRKATALTVAYSGDSTFDSATASAKRMDPTVTSRVSAARIQRAGWYASLVRVGYVCKAGSAPLTNGCPVGVAVTRQGVTTVPGKTVSAVDGGSAVVRPVTVRIDTVAPTVRIVGLHGTRNLPRAPRLTCQSQDKGSGGATCTIAAQRQGNVVLYRATATDKAGNIGRATVRVTLRRR